MRVKQYNSAAKWLIIIAMLISLSGCGRSDNEIISKDIKDIPELNETVLQDSVIDVDVLHSENKTVERKKCEDIDVIQEDEYVQHNNNLGNGVSVFPYQTGYFYSIDKMQGDGPNPAYVYDDGRGKVTEYSELFGDRVSLEYTSDDYIYYSDWEKNSLFREKNGESESVIEFKYFGGYFRCYAEDGIYYTDIDEDKEVSYIGKVGYDGTDNRELYKLDVEVEQVFKYQDDLWFVYSKFGGGRDRVGRIHLPDNKVSVYKEITPKKNLNLLSFNNGYLYYNSAGLNRLNIQEDVLEQVYEDNAQINFTEDSIWFCTEKNLYKMSRDGVKEIMKLKGNTEGFNGILVDNDKIYIEIYGGSLYTGFYQMDEAGKIVKHWDSDEINKALGYLKK